mmetsp:Transcript_16437/g.49040  ORF Transcript_16437/g.49040 Transcript_16437/m.49040 type:complete len:264 (-) Transcript_16437:171-962(-)
MPTADRLQDALRGEADAARQRVPCRVVLLGPGGERVQQRRGRQRALAQHPGDVGGGHVLRELRRADVLRQATPEERHDAIGPHPREDAERHRSEGRKLRQLRRGELAVGDAELQGRAPDGVVAGRRRVGEALRAAAVQLLEFAVLPDEPYQLRLRGEERHVQRGVAVGVPPQRGPPGEQGLDQIHGAAPPLAKDGGVQHVVMLRGTPGDLRVERSAELEQRGDHGPVARGGREVDGLAAALLDEALETRLVREAVVYLGGSRL